MFSFGLFVIGSVGVLGGNILRFAISRQREFAADTTAARLTQDPKALIQVLRKIKYRSLIDAAYSAEMARLFFGSVFPNQFWATLLRTRPSVEARIRRLKAIARFGKGLVERRGDVPTPVWASWRVDAWRRNERG